MSWIIHSPYYLFVSSSTCQPNRDHIMPYPVNEYMQWAKVGAPWNKPGLINCASSGIFEMRKTYRELFGELPGDISLTSSADEYGHPELKAAIAFRYGVLPANVYPACGTSMANYVAVAGTIDRDDTVIVEQPVYEPILGAVSVLGARVVRYHRREENGWRLDIDELTRIATNEEARLIVLTSPHNPSGVWTSDDDLILLADTVGEDTLILVDEVYREWGVSEAGKTVALKRPNLMITSSLTKVWGLGRLRAGWVIADERIIHDVSRAYDHMGAVGPSPIDSISARFLADIHLPDALRQESIDHVKRGRDIIEKWLEMDDRFVADIQPDSGFAILKCVDPDLLQQSGHPSLHHWFLNEHNILSTPGHFFDIPENYVRFAWSQGEDVVQRATEKLLRQLR
jgi:aspartate/methionine/tyrosine aminotransferase